MAGKGSVFGFLLGLVLLGCSTDPEVAKQRLLETANGYFDRGRYKEAALIYRRAIQTDRRFGEAYYRLGLAQLRLGRVQGAFNALTRATELQPENADAFEKLADIYISAAAASPAKKGPLMSELQNLADRAERTEIDRYQIVRVRGYISLAKGEDDAAVEFLTEAWGRKPEDRNLPAAIVSALMGLDRLDEAESTALEAIEKDPGAERLYDLVYRIYSRQGRQAHAEEISQRKVKNIPDLALARLQLAGHYHGTNQLEARDNVLLEMTTDLKRFPTAYEAAGDFYLRIGEPDAAIAILREAAEKNPEQESKHLSRIAQALAVKGSYAEALALLDEVLEEDPNNNAARMIRSSLRIHSLDPDEVRETVAELEELIPRMPENPVLRFNLGKAYEAMGNQDRALVQFQESARLRSDYVPARLAMGHIYLRQGQAAPAQQQAEQVLEIRPGNLPAMMLKAGALIALKQYPEARQLTARLLKEHPENRGLQYLMASLEFEEKEYAKAEQIVRGLRSSAPSDPRAAESLVGIYLAQDKHEMARQVLDQEIERGSESANLLRVKARVSVRARNYDRAITEYERAIALEPNSPQMHVEAGTAQYFAKRLDEAETYYRKARQLDPKHLEATLRLAMLLGEMDKKEETRQLLDEILTLAPDNPVALNNLAYILSDSPESLDTALSLAQRANDRAPRTPQIMDTLGWIYLKKNLSDEAVRVYGDLVAIDPATSTWRYHYAMALYQKGALQDATP